MTLERFTDEMAKKMINKDEDEEIRQIFLAFDSQCKSYMYINVPIAYNARSVLKV